MVHMIQNCLDANKCYVVQKAQLRNPLYVGDEACSEESSLALKSRRDFIRSTKQDFFCGQIFTFKIFS